MNTTLPDTILKKLKREHLGREKPILLLDLMLYLLRIRAIKVIDKNSERTVRLAIAPNLRICNAGNGYYLARIRGHKEDVELAQEYTHRTYVVPLEVKMNRKKKAFPQYYPNYDERQGELDL